MPDGEGVSDEAGMAAPARTKRRSPVTSIDARRAILLAAEQLIALYGPEAVSFRAIGLLAGQRNKSAVAYHFNDMSNLIYEVMRLRGEELEGPRRMLRDELLSRGDPEDFVSLYRALNVPVISVYSEAVPHIFARFQLRVLGSKYIHSQFMSEIRNVNRPVRTDLMNRIRKLCHHLNDAEFEFGMSLSSIHVYSSILLFDNEAEYGEDRQSLESVYERAISLTPSIMRIPPKKAGRARRNAATAP